MLYSVNGKSIGYRKNTLDLCEQRMRDYQYDLLSGMTTDAIFYESKPNDIVTVQLLKPPTMEVAETLTFRVTNILNVTHIYGGDPNLKTILCERITG